MSLCVPGFHHHCSSSPTELVRFTEFPENGLIYIYLCNDDAFRYGIIGSCSVFFWGLGDSRFGRMCMIGFDI